jgi:hypothetical protein
MIYAPTRTPVAVDPPVAADTTALTLDEALTLKRVTDRAWQVCDSRHAPHSPGFLLGFVEQVGDGVELMQLGDKFIWTGFPTMKAALAHVAATAYVTAGERSTGDLAWIG